MMQPIILASSSPARRKLMERLQLPFEVAIPDIDETPLLNEPAADLVARLTKQKALAVAKQFPEHFIISSDQVLIINDQPLSKPENHEDAIYQLLSKSGKSIEALTGIGLLNTKTQNFQYACVPTTIKYKNLTREKIENYLRKDQPYHCAGSLKVESLGIALLEKIHSDDPTALIGLPLIALVSFFESEGIDVVAF